MVQGPNLLCLADSFDAVLSLASVTNAATVKISVRALMDKQTSKSANYNIALDWKSTEINETDLSETNVRSLASTKPLNTQKNADFSKHPGVLAG